MYFFIIVFNKHITSSEVLESRFPVGSSASIIAGLATNARAIATLCCCPPDNVFGSASTLLSKPKEFIISVTNGLLISFPSSPTGSVIFSHTLSDGIRLKF